jgi:transposase
MATLFQEHLSIEIINRHCEQLTIHRTQLMNQLLSLNVGMYQNKPINQHLKKLISLIESQIKDTKVQIEVIIKNDPEILKRFNNIISIKGVGMLTLAVIISETNGFELFQNQRQLTSYAGYDIVENSSGKRIGKTRISKKGNSHIRRAMYMPALSVVRYKNPVFVSLYNRILQRTNKKMKAYVAVQRKLLCLVYTLWKKDEVYNPNILKTSGNDEPKQLFPLGFEEAGKVVVPIQKYQDYTR